MDHWLGAGLGSRLQACLETGAPLWLFLDYGGTLAEFAPTPDDILPDIELIELIYALSQMDDLRVTIISGRRLAHIERLVPVHGILLAGSYGIELRLPDGSTHERLNYEALRPALSTLKPFWQEAIEGMSGFYLEDKGWTLALHARYASVSEAARTLSQARGIAERILPGELFILYGGDRFLEAAPRHQANKRATVEYLVAEFPFADALLLYLGDDDKDAFAFGAVHRFGGVAGMVGEREPEASADFRLRDPSEARRFLNEILAFRRRASN